MVFYLFFSAHQGPAALSLKPSEASASLSSIHISLALPPTGTASPSALPRTLSRPMLFPTFDPLPEPLEGDHHPTAPPPRSPCSFLSMQAPSRSTLSSRSTRTVANHCGHRASPQLRRCARSMHRCRPQLAVIRAPPLLPSTRGNPVSGITPPSLHDTLTPTVGFRDPATLERFELWGVCGDLNLPSLPTRDPP